MERPVPALLKALGQVFLIPLSNDLSQRFWASYTSVFEKRRYRPPMAALCKAPTKSAGISLSITTVCKNAGKNTLGQDDFFVVYLRQ